MFVAVEDEDGGRVPVRAELGLHINPIQVVTVDMIATSMPRPIALAAHIEAMADDPYLTGHPEWNVIVEEAKRVLENHSAQQHHASA